MVFVKTGIFFFNHLLDWPMFTPSYPEPESYHFEINSETQELYNVTLRATWQNDTSMYL